MYDMFFKNTFYYSIDQRDNFKQAVSFVFVYFAVKCLKD